MPHNICSWCANQDMQCAVSFSELTVNERTGNVSACPGFESKMVATARRWLKGGRDEEETTGTPTE